MDFNRENGGMPLGSRFAPVTGTIVDIVATRLGGQRANGCMNYMSIEDMDGNIVNFLVTPFTYAVDFETLSVGMNCTFWYDVQAPVPLIFPPQYNAVVAAQNKNGRMIDVSYYDENMVNAEQTLQLHMDGSVEVRTTNNQYFQGSPMNHNLVVFYENSTRSIPAQTTPRKIVVLCDNVFVH
ncbi:MAG: hypothetical protein ACI4HQ_02830 [Acetatifactor sp.]